MSIAKEEEPQEKLLADKVAANVPKSRVSQLVQKQWCGAYALLSQKFSAATVGSKSLNLQALKVSLVVIYPRIYPRMACDVMSCNT